MWDAFFPRKLHRLMLLLLCLAENDALKEELKKKSLPPMNMAFGWVNHFFYGRRRLRGPQRRRGFSLFIYIYTIFFSHTRVFFPTVSNSFLQSPFTSSNHIYIEQKKQKKGSSRKCKQIGKKWTNLLKK